LTARLKMDRLPSRKSNVVTKHGKGPQGKRQMERKKQGKKTSKYQGGEKL